MRPPGRPGYLTEPPFVPVPFAIWFAFRFVRHAGQVISRGSANRLRIAGIRQDRRLARWGGCRFCRGRGRLIGRPVPNTVYAVRFIDRVAEPLVVFRLRPLHVILKRGVLARGDFVGVFAEHMLRNVPALGIALFAIGVGRGVVTFGAARVLVPELECLHVGVIIGKPLQGLRPARRFHRLLDLVAERDLRV